MRIAQIAPLTESVPPKRYGGTERVVSWLTEHLVALGHDVTLFASGDSETRARLVSACPEAMRGGSASPSAYATLQLEQVAALAHDFDLLHFHIDYAHYPLVRRLGVPHLSTLHGRLDIPDLEPVYREFREMPVVSISDAQRRPLPWLNWAATVYHGLPPESCRFRDRSGEYLAFIGRISPEKRADLAIEIAQRAGMPLHIAAKVDPADVEYFQTHIKPLLNQPGVEFIGEIGDEAKSEFLGHAAAMLFPIDWPEPFGLVMIESMACGTPVIAFRRGSVPEVMEDGVTGFVVDDVDEAVEATRRVAEIPRRCCREVFEKRFSVGRMTEDYLNVYRRLLAHDSEPHLPQRARR